MNALRWPGLRVLGAWLALAVVPALVPAAAAPPLQSRSVHSSGAVVPIGGGLRADNDAIWERLVQLAGGPGARFVVVGLASADPAASAGKVVAWLAQRGAVAHALPIAANAPAADLDRLLRDPAVLAQVQAARGVFFTGGSQERIVNALQPGGQPTPLLGAITDLVRRGGVVAGTSAGAAVMSRVMFRDAPSVVRVLKGELHEGVQIDRGLGFVGPDLFVDQHFLQRGRVARLIPAMQAKGFRLGLGLDNNTAAVFLGGEVEIVGAGGAVFVDLSEATSDPAQPAFNLRNARLAYLEQGDRIALASRTVRPAPAKLSGQRLEPARSDFKPFHTAPRFVMDMTGDQALANAMRYLVDSNQSEVRGLAFDPLPHPDDPQPNLGFVFRLHKGSDSMGWSTDAQGGERTTVVGVRLDITPVRVAQPLFSDWPAAPAR